MNKELSSIFLQIDEANGNWLRSFNEDKGNVVKHYLESSYLFPEKTGLIKGNNEISNYYKSNYKNISNICEIIIDDRILENNNLVYETGHFTTVNGSDYQYLVIWNNEKNTWLRELEMVAKSIHNQVNVAEIEQSRTDWMKFCNSHEPTALVNEIYTSNAFYYNRGRLLHGPDEIIPEYSYMNNDSFSLFLEPKIVNTVQPELVYEIGKCSGSYFGHYILRWEKEPAGRWKVSLDSNY